LTVLLTPKDVSAIRHDEANKDSAVFLARAAGSTTLLEHDSSTSTLIRRYRMFKETV